MSGGGRVKSMVRDASKSYSEVVVVAPARLQVSGRSDEERKGWRNLVLPQDEQRKATHTTFECPSFPLLPLTSSLPQTAKNITR